MASSNANEYMQWAARNIEIRTKAISDVRKRKKAALKIAQKYIFNYGDLDFDIFSAFIRSNIHTIISYIRGNGYSPYYSRFVHNEQWRTLMQYCNEESKAHLNDFRVNRFETQIQSIMKNLSGSKMMIHEAIALLKRCTRRREGRGTISTEETTEENTTKKKIEVFALSSFKNLRYLSSGDGPNHVVMLVELFPVLLFFTKHFIGEKAFMQTARKQGPVLPFPFIKCEEEFVNKLCVFKNLPQMGTYLVFNFVLSNKNYVNCPMYMSDIRLDVTVPSWLHQTGTVVPRYRLSMPQRCRLKLRRILENVSRSNNVVFDIQSIIQLRKLVLMMEAPMFAQYNNNMQLKCDGLTYVSYDGSCVDAEYIDSIRQEMITVCRIIAPIADIILKQYCGLKEGSFKLLLF